MLRMDLHSERYFIIVHAYDLKAPTVKGVAKKPVWRLYLNMSSPGQNFQTAVARMSNVARQFAGRNLEEIETVSPKEHGGKVDIGEVEIIGVVDN